MAADTNKKMQQHKADSVHHIVDAVSAVDAVDAVSAVSAVEPVEPVEPAEVPTAFWAGLLDAVSSRYDESLRIVSTDVGMLVAVQRALGGRILRTKAHTELRFQGALRSVVENAVAPHRRSGSREWTRGFVSALRLGENDRGFGVTRKNDPELLHIVKRGLELVIPDIRVKISDTMLRVNRKGDVAALAQFRQACRSSFRAEDADNPELNELNEAAAARTLEAVNRQRVAEGKRVLSQRLSDAQRETIDRLVWQGMPHRAVAHFAQCTLAQVYAHERKSLA